MDIEATRIVRQKYRSPSGQGHSERIMDIVNAITRVRIFFLCANAYYMILFS